VARIDIPDGDGGEEARVWGLRPEMAGGVGTMIDTAYHKSKLPAREREAARMRIALLNGCEICQNYRARSFAEQGVTPDLYAHVHEAQDRDDYTEREKLAIEFAERFALDHQGIDDDFFSRLRGPFADDEILDLTICCAVFLGLGRMLTVLGITADFGHIPQPA
jgi:alkylhydroperoxidase family enzyme